MRILVSNDDGVSAHGLKCLADGFKNWGQLKVIAPEKEKSTTGHSLTLHKPLRMRHEPDGFFACNGGPADCVYLGAHELFSKKPDLVLSGINRGANMGQDVFYSGTVSAAREASVMGIPAVAVSLCLDKEWGKLLKNPQHKFSSEFESAARASVKVLDRVLRALAGGGAGEVARRAGLRAWPKGMVLNINVPNLPFHKLKGYKVVHQGKRVYSGEIVKRKDARGRPYYWIGGVYQGFKEIPDTDNFVVDQGFVAVTPLELDTTDRQSFAMLKEIF